MAYQDLRTYLDALSQEGQLIRVTDSVLPEPDISAAACAVNKLGDKAPALLFENIQGYTDARIAMNVHGSWRNHALMLGMPKDTPLKEQFHEFVRRYQTYPGTVEERGEAPWQAVQIDKDINLFDILPLFRLNHGDGGFYIDKSCIVSRDMSAIRAFVPWHAVDGNRLPDGREHLRAASRAIKRSVPRSAGCQRAIHTRPSGNRIDQMSFRRLRKRRRHARAHHAARAGLCEVGDRRR
jgi:hypothetical protein